MSDDRQLLRRFAAERSESAFSELVARHLPLVYSTALRQTQGDAHLAQDVAQLVFTDLARKAPALSGNVVLAGWLHRATIFAARQVLRGERRRRVREQQAVAMSAVQSETDDAVWRQIRPLLDEALERLNKSDRDALLLRFFEQQSLAEIGARQGGTEDAARKRIARALEKLRGIFQRRGVTTTATALSAAISANAVQVAPSSLVAVVANSSLVAAGTGTTFALLKIMTTTHLKLGLSALVAAGAVATFIVQRQIQARLRAENQSLRDQIAQLQSDNEDWSNRLAEANDAKKLSAEQFDDLLRLRGEVGLLRRRTNELARLQSSLENTLQSAESSAETNSASQQEKQVALAKLTDAHNLAVCFYLYADNNQGQFPTNFDQIDAYTNGYPVTGTNDFEIVYQGSLNATNLNDAIVIEEPQAWQTADGRWAKVYGFADGHSEVQVRANGDFSAFEQQHTFLPPAGSQ